MVAFGSVRLWEPLDPHVPFRFGERQFVIRFRPLGKQARPAGASRGAARARSVGSGDRARAVMGGGGGSGAACARTQCTWAGARVTQIAVRRKLPLRWSASIRSKGMPVAIARIRPGK